MPGLTVIGDTLHEEHLRTLRILNALEMVLTGRAANRPIDVGDASCRRNLEDFIAAVDHDVTRHFSFEEDHLFPILRAAGATDMVDMLTHEHAVIRPMAEALRREIGRALEHGFEVAGWGRFRDATLELIERESFHIQKEEMGLIRALPRFLDAETESRLAEIYLRVAE
jgi:hemerythrin-like domain-containing protein